jgi:hypothetical protein
MTKRNINSYVGRFCRSWADLLFDILCLLEKTLDLVDGDCGMWLKGGRCQISLNGLDRASLFASVVSECLAEGKRTYLSYPSVHTLRHDISSRLLRSIDGYRASESARFLAMHLSPPLGSEVRHCLLLAFEKNPS